VIATAERISLLAFAAVANQSSLTETTCLPKLTDRTTGLFTRAYIQNHLARQIKAAENNETVLTILTLKLKSGADQDIAARSAQPDLARIVKLMLREVDCGARYDDTTLVLSLPGTNYSGAVRLAGRIVEKLGGDNLGAPGTPLPFGGSLSWRAVERRRYHTSATLISSAMIGPFSRVQVA
jgi:GGDEF domain-containing protein